MWRHRILQWALLTLFWLLLIFKLDIADIAAAAIGAFVTSTGISIGSRQLQAHFKLPEGWASPIKSLPGKIVVDTWHVFAALFRKIVLRQRVYGELITVPFDYGSNSPADSTRLALTISYISVTPNTVAVMASKDGILLHQLEPSRHPPESRDPKWPV